MSDVFVLEISRTFMKPWLPKAKEPAAPSQELRMHRTSVVRWTAKFSSLVLSPAMWMPTM